MTNFYETIEPIVAPINRFMLHKNLRLRPQGYAVLALSLGCAFWLIHINILGILMSHNISVLWAWPVFSGLMTPSVYTLVFLLEDENNILPILEDIHRIFSIGLK